MSRLAALSESLRVAQSGSPLNLGGGGIGNLLDALSIVRELSQLAEVGAPIDSTAGLEERLEILLNAAARAASLSGTNEDDQWVARIRAELMVPEVLGFVAYLIRRAK